MNYQDSKKRIQSAITLLSEETTSREKFSHITTLLKGIHPNIDKTLAKCEEQLIVVEQLYDGAVIELTAGAMPEDTEERKKRKKALLLLIGLWKDLKSEVARVGKGLENSGGNSSTPQGRSLWGKIFGLAKGPFGITTIVAVAIAGTLQATAVRVVIKNSGCVTMQMSSFTSIPLPGLSLPNGPLSDKGTATATIPPLTVSTDGTEPGAIKLTSLGMSFTYTFPRNIDDVRWNDISLLGRETEIRLSEHDEHSLVFACR